MMKFLALFLCFSPFFLSAEGKGPNFVWIVSEDNSKHYLKLFDERGTETPNIAKLAENGLIFSRAFSNAPVCSVARTTLATGCYAPRIGTHYHRRSKLAEMPEGLKMFAAYLRDAGYYTTNNSKKDYNAVEGTGVWDESSGKADWRNRPKPEQSFFHMQSHGESHEGRLHFSEEQYKTQKTETDPATTPLQEYFPDTDLFRYTAAKYRDDHKKIDNIVGKTVEKLREDGLLEDTFIFYFGDHGGVLPRSKGYIYESGVHVPLVVRVPEKWKHLVDAQRGDTVNGFVSFIDFGPTLLKLAGLEVPKQMDGVPFLGNGVSMDEVNKRDTVFSHADRFDEKYDMVRAVRIGKWKYIRNYQPFYPDGLQNNYRYKMLAYQEWRTLFKERKLGSSQRLFFEAKQVEALYDLESDPDEVNNLAGESAHQDRLMAMRETLQEKVKSLPDLGFFPESVLYDEAMNNPVEFGRKNRDRIAQMLEAADLALQSYEEIEESLEEALGSSDPMIRYWAANTCTSLGEAASDMVEKAETLLKDENLLVRVKTAEFLAEVKQQDPRSTFTEVLNTTQNPVEALITLNSVVYLQDHGAISYPLDPANLKMKVDDGEVYRRIAYLNGNPNPPKPGKKKKKKG